MKQLKFDSSITIKVTKPIRDAYVSGKITPDEVREFLLKKISKKTN